VRLYFPQSSRLTRKWAKNGLQALALSHNLCQGRKLRSAAGQQAFQALKLREAAARKRQDLLQLMAQLNGWIEQIARRLGQQAEKRPDAQRLKTHSGVGLVTALATVVVLGRSIALQTVGRWPVMCS
jgi:hypothetical protein